MKKMVSTLTVLVLLVSCFAMTAALAEPGKGKGCPQNNRHCLKWCGEPPAGCSYFECSKCGCDFICNDGTMVSMPSLVSADGESFDDTVSLSASVSYETPNWTGPFIVNPVRWPVPLK